MSQRDDIEELLSVRPERVVPRSGFEQEVFNRLISTQRRRPRIKRLGYADLPAETLSAAARNVLLAITAFGAAAAIAIAVGSRSQLAELAPVVEVAREAPASRREGPDRPDALRSMWHSARPMVSRAAARNGAC